MKNYLTVSVFAGREPKNELVQGDKGRGRDGGRWGDPRTTFYKGRGRGDH